MTTNPTPYLFWITSRAAGFAALILASLAVSLGLLMSTKLIVRRRSELLTAHEALSLSAIAAVAVHGLSLLGDSYLHPSLADISIPFVGSYRTVWTSLGIVAGWSMALLGLSYYARRFIGAARWRRLHRLTVVVWLMGVAHALGEGTDAGQAWFLAMVALVALPALGLVAVRWAPAPWGPAFVARLGLPYSKRAQGQTPLPAADRAVRRPAQRGRGRAGYGTVSRG